MSVPIPMRCSSCQFMVDVTQITRRKSKVIDSMHVSICDSCESRGLEPRHLIVIAARQNPKGRAAYYIKNDLYVGNSILASEIV